MKKKTENLMHKYLRVYPLLCDPTQPGKIGNSE